MKHWQLAPLEQLHLTINLNGQFLQSHAFFGGGRGGWRGITDHSEASSCDQGLLRNREAEL